MEHRGRRREEYGSRPSQPLAFADIEVVVVDVGVRPTHPGQTDKDRFMALMSQRERVTA
ncbi:MAG: hypothetical protein IH957_07580 [Chloroflexi bacterium]|nr:hypothetical protein [Chloroflexota bacterium]